MSPHIDLLAHLARPRSRSLRRSTSVWAPSRHWATVAGHAAFGDEAWSGLSDAVDALRDAGSTDYDRVGRLTGHALEGIVRWTGTRCSRFPTRTLARRYLDYAMAHIDESDSEARVRLMTALAFWEHGYRVYRERVPRSGTSPSGPAPAAADMALRLARPELAVVALDSVQYNLQRQLRYRAAMDSARRRVELARVRVTSASWETASRLQLGTRTTSASSRRRA